MRAPIHSIKHYNQTSLSTVAAGAALAIPIAKAVESTTANLANEVREGSIVKAVFVEMWVRSGDGVEGAVLVTIVKTPQNATPTFANMIALHSYVNKKNIFYHTQGLSNDQNADAIPFVRGWFKIPKTKQRFGLGDSLFVVITAQANEADVCGFTTYKEYT